jgi:hypothetical protein
MWEKKLLTGFWCGKLRKRGPRRRWEENIKMDLQDAGWAFGLDSFSLGQEQVVGSWECSNEPSVSINCG